MTIFPNKFWPKWSSDDHTPTGIQKPVIDRNVLAGHTWRARNIYNIYIPGEKKERGKPVLLSTVKQITGQERWFSWRNKWDQSFPKFLCNFIRYISILLIKVKFGELKEFTAVTTMHKAKSVLEVVTLKWVS